MDTADTKEIQLGDGPSISLHQTFTGTTAGQVWDAGLVLAHFLATPAMRTVLASQPRVVELGSGTGIVAISAAALGAHAIATDLATALPLLEHNIVQNKSAFDTAGGSCAAEVLCWGEPPPEHLRSPDFVLASDCIFAKELVEPLIRTLRYLCCASSSADSCTTIIICNEERESSGNRAAELAFAEMCTGIFEVEVVQAQELDTEYVSSDITVKRLHLRKQQQ